MSLQSVTDQAKHALQTIKEDGFTPAKKGDAFLIKCSYTSLDMKYRKITYDIFNVYKVVSATRDGKVKKACRDHGIVVSDHNLTGQKWMIPAAKCKDIDLLCELFAGHGIVDNLGMAECYVRNCVRDINNGTAVSCMPV